MNQIISDVFYAKDLADCYGVFNNLRKAFPTAGLSSECSDDGIHRLFLTCCMSQVRYFEILEETGLGKISLEVRCRG